MIFSDRLRREVQGTGDLGRRGVALSLHHLPEVEAVQGISEGHQAIQLPKTWRYSLVGQLHQQPHLLLSQERQKRKDQPIQQAQHLLPRPQQNSLLRQPGHEHRAKDHLPLG